MALRLGDLLIQHGLITESQLAEALRTQQIFGGRLGSNLVELGFVTETTLAQVLSKQLELPCADAGDFESIAPDVVAKVKKETVEEHKVVPLGIDGQRIRLAMAHPTDLAAVDKISFETGMIVQPVVAPEILINYAMERYYQIGRSSRYMSLAGATQSEFQVIHPGTGGTTSLTDDSASSRADFLRTDTESPFGDSRPTVADLSKQMADLKSHAGLMDLVARYASHDFKSLALFAVRGSTANGWIQTGCSCSTEDLRRMSLPIERSKLLSHVTNANKVYVGAIPDGEVDQWLFKNLGMTGDIYCLPLITNGAPVALLGSNTDLKGAFPAPYGELATKFSYAVQMMYLRNRLLGN